MQQNQQGRRFGDTVPQQPVYRFPQNQPVQGWQPQRIVAQDTQVQEPQQSRQDRRALKRQHKRRRRIFTWWNCFAVIGIISVIVQFARYVVIPLLVYLNVLAGGVL